MDRKELVKQAFIETWEGFAAAVLEKKPGLIEADMLIPLADLSPMAAQIYRQLSSVTYIKMPPQSSRSDYDLVADIMEESDINAVILPQDIETISTEAEDE